MNGFTTIADACELVTDGTHYTPKDVGTGFPFLTVKDVSDSDLDFKRCSFISADDYLAAKAGNSAPQKGDILFSKDGTVGKVHVVSTDQPFAVLSSLAILRPKAGKVDSGFLGHVLRSPAVLDDALKKKTGSAIRRIVLGDLKRVQLPLPSVEEQRRIAAILDQADALRAKRREALAQLDCLTQAIFVEMFGDPVSNPKGWPVNALAGLVERIQIGPFGSQLHEEDYVEDGVPLVNPTHIKGGQIYPDRTLTVPDRKYQQLPQYHLSEGDLVLGRRGEMGRCAVVTAAENGWLCGTGSLFVRPNKQRLNPVYLGQVIASDSMRKYLENAAQGVTMPNLNKDIVGSIPVPVPSLPLQERFADALVANQGLRNVSVRASLELDTLFTSLQHRAFAGEL